jgi:hypothetical protein
MTLAGLNTPPFFFGENTMTIKKTVDTTEVKMDSLKPATDVEASGAMIEPTIVERIDTAHPAVDNEPRKGASVASNQIDFNTPSALTTEEDEVVENLKAG